MDTEQAKQMVGKRWASRPIVKCGTCGKTHRCRAATATLDELKEGGIVTTADKMPEPREKEQTLAAGAMPVTAEMGQDDVQRAKNAAMLRFIKSQEK